MEETKYLNIKRVHEHFRVYCRGVAYRRRRLHQMYRNRYVTPRQTAFIVPPRLFRMPKLLNTATMLSIPYFPLPKTLTLLAACLITRVYFLLQYDTVYTRFEQCKDQARLPF